MSIKANAGSYSKWLMFNRYRPISELKPIDRHTKRRDNRKHKNFMVESIISNLEYYSFPKRLEKIIRKQDYNFINILHNNIDNPEAFYDLLEALL